MEKYGVEIAKPWLSMLSKTNDGGVMVAFPKAGVDRVLANSIEGIEGFAGWGGIDVSIYKTDLQKMKDHLESLVDQVISAGGRFVLVSGLNLDKKLAEKRVEIMKQVRLGMAKKINYIVALYVDPRVEKKNWVDKYHDILLNNIVFLPYSQGDMWQQLTKQLETRYEIKMGDKEQVILSLSGGCPHLAKHLVKRLSASGSLDIDEEMQSWGKVILESLPGRWLSWLKNWEKLTDDKKEMLVKLNVIDEKGELRSGILAESLKELIYVPTLKIVNKKIVVDGREQKDEFSMSEIDILEKLLETKKLSREEVAVICWGNSKSEDYSEYALDKLMSNLRGKLVKMGFDKEYIATQKGVGYKLYE